MPYGRKHFGILLILDATRVVYPRIACIAYKSFGKLVFLQLECRIAPSLPRAYVGPVRGIVGRGCGFARRQTEARVEI